MFPIKLTFQNEVRRVQVFNDAGPRQTLSYGTLVQTAKNVFPQLIEGTVVTFQWRDDENDVISCSTDEELAEAVRVMMSENKPTFKFEVKTQGPQTASAQPSQASSGVAHTRVTCDQCGMSPIIGVRYKCCVRNDYDLCEGCEAASAQPHPMIKIYRPEQAPAAIFVAVNEQQEPHEFRRRPQWGGGPNRGPCGGGGPSRGRGGCPFRREGPSQQAEQQPSADGPRWGRRGVDGRCNRRWGHDGAQEFVGAAAQAFANMVDPAVKIASEQGPFADFLNAFRHPAPNQPPQEQQPVGGVETQEAPISAEEQQLLDAVMRESLEDFGAPVVVPPAEAPAHVASPMSDDFVEVPPVSAQPDVPQPPAMASVSIPSPAAQVEDHEDEEQQPEATALAAWARMWVKELEVLNAMGFTDTADLIPLLQQFLGVPMSLNPSQNGEIPVEKMQRLVAHLLGRSV